MDGCRAGALTPAKKFNTVKVCLTGIVILIIEISHDDNRNKSFYFIPQKDLC